MEIKKDEYKPYADNVMPDGKTVVYIEDPGHGNRIDVRSFRLTSKEKAEPYSYTMDEILKLLADGIKFRMLQQAEQIKNFIEAQA